MANTDASLEFDVPNIQQQQQQLILLLQQQQQFGHRLAEVEATQARLGAAILNTRILSHNYTI
jgi:hypothetical protein